QPRVLDFGLAKRRRVEALPNQNDEILDVLPATAPLDATPPSSKSSKDGLTEKGAILGTPSYMAPEQARAALDEIGPPADVHALGAIFYEMLTGRPPFQAPATMDTLLQVLERKPRPIREMNRTVPAALEAFCDCCLAKDPAERFPDA